MHESQARACKISLAEQKLSGATPLALAWPILNE
jgi:hypothetical protein